MSVSADRSPAALARALAVAEDRLRALGLTGAQAFDALLPALEARLGLSRSEGADPAVRAIAAQIPLASGGDLLGLAYERFFADLFKGRLGQFFTPEAVARLLVSRLQIAPGERALDPTCGSGGLLVHAARAGARVQGIDVDPRLSRLASLNLAMLGATYEIRCADLFLSDPEPVDVLIANPPFSVEIDDPEILSRYDAGRGRRRALSDVLFLEAIERWVRPSGRAGLVLPWSLLSGSRAAAVRERIDSAWVRTAICALPEGVFRPFGGAAGRAMLLWLVRRPAPDQECLFGELSDPGYDVRSLRYRPTSEAELRERIAGSGFVNLPRGLWAPPPLQRTIARPLREIASVRSERAQKPSALADLADADRSTGELHPLPAAGPSDGRQRLAPGDVVVSRMRPNLGNVAIVPEREGIAGSPEWIALAGASHPHLLLHLLRAPAWRDRLPVPSGQTRPRISAEDVLDSAVRWPAERSDLADAVDSLSRRLFEARRAAREALLALQGAVDRYAAQEIDEDELMSILSAIEGPHGRFAPISG